MKDKKVSDISLIEQFKKGCLDSFEELVSRYKTKVYNLAIRLTRNPEDAEEVLQDVFSTLYQKVHFFQGKSAFSSWLYRIVMNAAFMKLRKRKQYNTISIEDLSPMSRQECLDRDALSLSRSYSFTLTREVRDVLSSAINKLPTQYRAVFVLRDVDGLSNQEVGEVLSISIPAVKSRLHRSRLMLRRRLKSYYDDYRGITKASRRRITIPSPA